MQMQLGITRPIYHWHSGPGEQLRGKPVGYFVCLFVY